MGDNREWAREHSGQTAPTGDVPILVALGEISNKLDDIEKGLIMISSALVMMLPKETIGRSSEVRELAMNLSRQLKSYAPKEDR